MAAKSSHYNSMVDCLADHQRMRRQYHIVSRTGDHFWGFAGKSCRNFLLENCFNVNNSNNCRVSCRMAIRAFVSGSQWMESTDVFGCAGSVGGRGFETHHDTDQNCAGGIFCSAVSDLVSDGCAGGGDQYVCSAS